MADQPAAVPVRRSPGRFAGAAAWTLIALGVLALLISHLTPFELRAQSDQLCTLMWIAFLLRTVAFHAGWIWLPIAGLAAWSKRGRLTTAALALLFVSLATAWRDFAPCAPVAVDSPTLRVLSANLFAFSGDHPPLVNEILAADADVLVLQEYTASWHASLHPALGQRYPFHALSPREHCHGIALYSRVEPSEPPTASLILGREGAPQVRVVVPLGERRVVLYGIHTLPPNSVAYFREQCLQVTNLLQRAGQESDPVILAGDMNFTNASVFADRLVAAGFSDVHWQAGSGRGATWVRSPRYPWLPGIRIDHIYLPPTLGCRATRVGYGEGSDHRPVIAEIGFRQDP